MRHIDLFSGVGGFALAVDTVWPNSEHIFCDNDPFCQQVLKKHWPNSQIYGDIRTLTSNSTSQRFGSGSSDRQERHILQTQVGQIEEDKQEWGGRFNRAGSDTFLLTGGFPCQPFSQAGRRQGTADDRYLWPEMFRVIREFKPTWVIAENVRGLVTWNEGLVLEQVCSDLESEGYEVQPLIIPAVAVNAPHRRDRIWFIANKRSAGLEEAGTEQQPARSRGSGSYAEDTIGERSRRRLESDGQVLGSEITKAKDARPSWEKNWVEVATELCRMDDGLPAELDGFNLSKAGHRNNRLKALGNAIVPQVAIEIMQTIKEANKLNK